MQIIPAIDIFGGKCVRLTEGVFTSQTVYSADPRAVARRFADAGAQRLHIVDLEGAKDGAMKNVSSIESILASESIELQVGGGIRSLETAGRLLEAGVTQLVIGSSAIRSPEIVAAWVEQFGAKRFIVALDFKDSQLAVDGWQSSATRQPTEVVDSMASIGIGCYLSTDIRRDGTMHGPNTELYKKLVDDFPSVKWIASGGVRSEYDIDQLKTTGVTGVVIGKAFYEGRLSLSILKEYQC